MLLALVSMLGCGTTSSAEAAQIEVGKPAPDFTLPNLEEVDVTLSSFQGKTVVLEWFNPGCPFVVSAHEGGPLEQMASAQPEDVV